MKYTSHAVGKKYISHYLYQISLHFQLQTMTVNLREISIVVFNNNLQ